MKKINITFSISEEVNKKLHTLVSRKKLNTFVSEALAKALEEKVKELKKAYAEAENDPDHQQLIEDWRVTDVEGWE